MNKKIYLTYPTDTIKEPLLYLANREFNVVTNIRQATVSDSVGVMALELEGEDSEIEKFIKFFEDKGVKVEPIELDIIE